MIELQKKDYPWYAHIMDTVIGKCATCGIKLIVNRCLACQHKAHDGCHGPKCCCECPCKGKKRKP